jgi:nucleotide-binding universal stress UspA family protein
MNIRGLKKQIERILVAVDASPQSLVALKVAANLASRLDAELIGIFVEDINLLHLARFPFARQISISTGNIRQLDSSIVERELRSQARWALHNLALLAEKFKIRWSFRVARGIIPTQLLAAALEADLTIIGKTGWSGRRWLGSTARKLVVQTSCTSLIIQKSFQIGVPVVILFDGSPASHKALGSIDSITSSETHLVVVILALEADEAGNLRREAYTYFADLEIQPHYRWFKKISSSDLIQLIKSEGCGILVIPTGSERIPHKIIVDTLNQSECAVLLVC